MPLPYNKNKIHIYNWREKNKEKYYSVTSNYNEKYYNWKKISKIFMNILLE
jgi:hypothetical protein